MRKAHPSRPRGIACATALAAAAVCLAIPGAAAAQLNYRIEPVPASWAVGEIVGYHLFLVSGSRPEQLTVAFDTPQHDNRGGEPIGSPLEDLRPGISGGGILTGTVPLGRGEYELGTCVRGGESRLGAVSLYLPANSSTLLRLRFRLRAPLSRSGFGLPVRILTTAGQRLSFRSAAPRLAGKLGLRIGLDDSFVSSSGSAVRVVGRTSATLAGRRVVIRGSSARKSFRGLFTRRLGYRRLASVRVRAGGRFSYLWRAPPPGWVQVKATYSGDRRFTRDQSCPVPLRVR